MSGRALGLVGLICALVAWHLAAADQKKLAPPVKRAKLPKLVRTDTFYEDAFKEGLVGERPANLGQPSVGIAASGGTGGAATPAAGGASGGGGNWSSIISAGSIEATIKAVKLDVDKEVTTASDFAGKGHKLARRDYSLLAVIFGIAGEYDGDVRWKKEAPVARDAFSRSAANFKVGTAQAFQEAKVRKEELAELVGGSSPYAGKTADAKATWSQVANRGPLMQYLEAAWEPRLKPALANKGALTAGADKVLRDAEVFAAIGEVLAKEGMEDADSEEYRAFCNRLRDGGRAIVDAIKTKNFEQAAGAAGTISKACSECHENYRS